MRADALSRNKALIVGIQCSGGDRKREFRGTRTFNVLAGGDFHEEDSYCRRCSSNRRRDGLASSNKAEAWWGWWWPGAVVGGVVAGAIVSSAVAPRPYYPFGYYGPYPYGPRCQRVWNGYAWVPAC